MSGRPPAPACPGEVDAGRARDIPLGSPGSLATARSLTFPSWSPPLPDVLPNDVVHMDHALALAAEAAALGEVPVGAVVVKDGKVLATGANTRERAQDPCGHAELHALREAASVLGSWRLDGATVYVTLEPCPMCAGAMVLSRIARCVYAASDPKGGFLGTLADLSSFPGLNHRFAVTAGVRGEEASAQLRGFFAGLRKRRRNDQVP
jgi:tRNA(adenine34) deaminase